MCWNGPKLFFRVLKRLLCVSIQRKEINMGYSLRYNWVEVVKYGQDFDSKRQGMRTGGNGTTTERNSDLTFRLFLSQT